MTVDSSGSPAATHGMKSTKSESSIHLENVLPTTASRDAPDDGRRVTDSPRDPRNWSRWKKNAQILMAAFHSMMGTFMAAGIIPAYDAFATQYNVTVPQASYLTSFQVRVVAEEVFWILAIASRDNHQIRSCCSACSPCFGTQ